MNINWNLLELNTEYSAKIDALNAKAQELEDMNQFLRDENARLTKKVDDLFEVLKSAVIIKPSACETKEPVILENQAWFEVSTEGIMLR